MKIFLALCLLLMPSFVSVQRPAYRFFDKEGNDVSYEAIVTELVDSDVVLFGEQHNNPICHWLQLQFSKDFFDQKQEKLVLGAEMFEADDQLILNEYLSGTIQEKHLIDEAKVWSNYSTDYASLVEFAKTNQLQFIATNVPRRYASLVAREGQSALDSLENLAKSYVCPLPFEVDMELPSYQNMLSMMGTHGQGKGENFVHAQAVKDATMAHFILQNWKEGQVLLHFNGSYHSNNFEGIYWYLKKRNKKLTIKTIASVEQASLDSLEEQNLNLADFVLAIPNDMTKTY